jgi:hypothetical protein
MTKFGVSFIISNNVTCYAVVNSDDENREKIDPDKLRNGLNDYILSSDKAIV